MLYMMRNKLNWGARLLGGLAAFLLAGSGAALAANVTVDLCATTGSVTMPAATSAINILGYVLGACPTTATAPGGPVIDVNVGDSMTVNLHNSLPAATGLLFQGQSMVPDTTGAAAATGAAYGAKTYTFIATNPGTFLYEAALLPNAEHQAAMGLHGALIVRPAAVPFTGISVTPTGSGTRSDATATYTSGSNVVVDTAAQLADVGAVVSGAGIPFGTTITAVSAGSSFTMSTRAAAAYGASTVFNDEAVLVLSELDPALNNNANPAAFDMRNYAPKYFLINGKAYPATTPIASAAGNKVLLRYVNAGVKHHSIAVLGLRQNFVAKDASLLPTLTLNVAAETLAPGQTGDAIATVPAVTTASKFAVYDGNLALHNNGADNAFGGMLTFVTAGTGAAATGPTTSAVALTPNPTNGSVSVALSASIKSSASTVAAAEYFIDTAGTAGGGLAMTGAFGSATVPVNATVSTAQLALLTSGNHTIYVHGKDASNQWGAFSTAVLNLDKAGPLTSGLTLTPNPSSGAVSVALHATGSDSASGGSNIAAAEYFRGATPPVTTRGTAMTVNVAAPVASLDASIPCSPASPCVAGAINVRSQDALGNWGAFATITLNVVAAGPVTSAVIAAPNPNNGARPLSASQPVVRVTATMTSTGSTVSAAEGFIDTVGATGTGFPFVPSDGVWNGPLETGYADIPLATINALSNGNHTIYVRGRDALGNWGSPSPATTTLTWPASAKVVLVIDKTPPTLTSITLAASTIAFGTNTSLTMVAADVGTSVVGGQYWFDGTTTPPANATVFTGTNPTIITSALAGGTHSVRVRVQDAAGNWSTVTSATLTVVQAVADAKSFNATGQDGTQTQSYNINGASLRVNDSPTSGSTALVSAPVRIAGSGTAVMTLSCPGGGGNTAAPAVGGSTICTNGRFNVNLSDPSGNNNAQMAARRGTYTFTYTISSGGVTSAPATVTITVN